ncbi:MULTISPECIES: tryptophan synthase subunit alpha [unclassified Virgibacillus]|uniref:tryptophan synthase subunit alpha n=1 Tax=unclassified Virgibacillus TaxID=2620237 RepID=UPI0024DED583|nr:tryptophan synthase subunit alpha [Virgibacillus sp. LDC-1]
MKKLALYLPCCYPNEARFFEILTLMDQYQVDVLELGVPVKDAHMDGAVIQESHKQVLSQGFNEEYFVEILQRIKEAFSFQIVLMTYKEGLESYRLLHEKQHLFDGLLCVDQALTVEDFPAPIQLYNEETSEDEMVKQLENNRLFAYCMSGIGKTGSFEKVPTNYIDTIKRIRNYSSIPVYVGFGIKEREDVSLVYQNGADGAIIGSHFVKKVRDCTLQEIGAYIKELKSIS